MQAQLSMLLWHWLIVFGVALFFVIPVARIIRGTGRSRWWCLLCFVPCANLIGLSVLALIRWPAVASSTR